MPSLSRDAGHERSSGARRTHGTRDMNAPLRDERGSVSVEAAVGLPAFALFIGLVVMGGRVAIADQAVEAAAFDAARAASAARTQSAAITTGRAAAEMSLASQDVRCATTTVVVDASAFNAPLGSTAQVSVTLTCRLRLTDLGLPGVDGRTITATARSPLDAYRERS